MRELVIANTLPHMAWQQICSVRRVEEMARTRPQVKIETRHVLHAGMYARSVRIPPGVMITGALIKIPTILTVSGYCALYIGSEFWRVYGYRVFAAAANRKQIFIAKKATDLTMCFPTQAKTVREAEEQFTDEAHLLQTREA